MKVFIGIFLLIFCCSCKQNAEINKLNNAINASNQITDTIFIQPFKGFSKIRLHIIAAQIEGFYSVKVKILPEITLFTSSLSNNNRYDASKILIELKKTIPNKKQKILGLTSFDIFNENKARKIKEWGIFGLGSTPGIACVVSDNRLKKFKNKTDDFVVNVVLHEIAHTYGLAHCNKTAKCLMNDAKGTIATLYKEDKWLCPSCKKQLKI
jgi:archaemetzincin